MVTVPTLGFGIMPRGPSTLPSRPTSGIRSGVAMQRSKSILPPCTFSTRSSAPTTSAPAAFASSALAPRANTADAHAAAGAVRQIDDAAHHLVGMARIDAEIHRDLDRLVELGLGALLDHLHRLFERIELGRDRRLRGRRRCVFRVWPWPLLPDLDAHRAGGAFHHAHGGLDGIAVQILHLLLGDLLAPAPWSRVPALSRPGVFDPLSSLAAFLMK